MRLCVGKGARCFDVTETPQRCKSCIWARGERGCRARKRRRGSNKETKCMHGARKRCASWTKKGNGIFWEKSGKTGWVEGSGSMMKSHFRQKAFATLDAKLFRKS